MDQREYEECEVCGRRSWDHAIDRELKAIAWRNGFKYYCHSHAPKPSSASSEKAKEDSHGEA
ncbi:MAG: hypothetical protein Unbinned5784contig1000_7 [Prokaryotic dsDNA virus sp.]|mgnify:CR=1 FL=1|nr:MAG: hypothetical protein Unbinned5784contig1000_7 [Prokaryotic dsDNA virus sp.]